MKIRKFKIGLLVILCMLLITSCSILQSEKKIISENEMIEAIFKEPKDARKTVKNSQYFFPIYSNRMIADTGYFYRFFNEAIYVMNKNKDLGHYLAIDTVVEVRDNYNTYRVHRKHIYYNENDYGIRFDFILKDGKSYLYKVDDILNKPKIIENSDKKLELIEQLLHNPDKYQEIIQNSEFYDKKYTEIEFNDKEKFSPFENLKDLHQSGYFFLKHYISFYLENYNSYPLHMIIYKNKNETNYYFLFFKFIDNKWIVRSDNVNWEFLQSVIYQEEENY
ncbi:MAG: hypothetical protein RO257_15210 [Candidatus Kapabacteria bacterium]|nr:hypothetical protein [Candidatus Kapabacteria bacterium]